MPLTDLRIDFSHSDARRNVTQVILVFLHLSVDKLISGQLTMCADGSVEEGEEGDRTPAPWLQIMKHSSVRHCGTRAWVLSVWSGASLDAESTPSRDSS